MAGVSWLLTSAFCLCLLPCLRQFTEQDPVRGGPRRCRTEPANTTRPPGGRRRRQRPSAACRALAAARRASRLTLGRDKRLEPLLTVAAHVLENRHSLVLVDGLATDGSEATAAARVGWGPPINLAPSRRA